MAGLTPYQVMLSKLGEREHGGKNQGIIVDWACGRWVSEERYAALLEEGEAEWCAGSVCSSYDDAGEAYAAAIRSKVIDPTTQKKYRIASLSAGALHSRIALSPLFITSNDPSFGLPRTSDIAWFKRVPPHKRAGRIHHVEIVEGIVAFKDLDDPLKRRLVSKEGSQTDDAQVLLCIGGNTGPASDSVARNARLLNSPRIAGYARLR